MAKTNFVVVVQMEYGGQPNVVGVYPSLQEASNQAHKFVNEGVDNPEHILDVELTADPLVSFGWKWESEEGYYKVFVQQR
jgi:hypothetical protein